jgi:hypothetical protein
MLSLPFVGAFFISLFLLVSLLDKLNCYIESFRFQNEKSRLSLSVKITKSKILIFLVFSKNILKHTKNIGIIRMKALTLYKNSIFGVDKIKSD